MDRIQVPEHFREKNHKYLLSVNKELWRYLKFVCDKEDQPNLSTKVNEILYKELVENSEQL